MKVCEDKNCRQTIEPCTECGAADSAIHDHEYGEYFCQEHWDAFSDQEKGLEWFKFVEETNGETETQSRAEGEARTS